jgi:hypothetical protein
MELRLIPSICDGFQMPSSSYLLSCVRSKIQLDNLQAEVGLVAYLKIDSEPVFTVQFSANLVHTCSVVGDQPGDSTKSGASVSRARREYIKSLGSWKR